MSAMPPSRGLVAPAETLWGTIRHELLFLSYALLEIALLTPVVMVLLGWARYWPASLVALWLLLVMLLPLNLVRLMSLLHISVGRQQRILMVALLLVVVLSWRQLLYTPAGPLDFSWLRVFAANLAEAGNLVWARDLSVFLITLLAWYRGVRLAGRQPEINNIGLRLRLGGLILAPLVIWFSSSFLDISIVPFILLFFLAALTAVTLVRAENVEQEQRGTASTLNAGWFAVVAGAALATVLTGGVLAAFLSGEPLPVVINWLSPLWRALQFGLSIAGAVLLKLTYPLLELLAVVVQFLSRILFFILGQVSAALRAANILPEEATPILPTPTATVPNPGAELAGKSVVVFVMLALIVLVGLGLARVYQRATFAARESDRSRTRLDDEEEEAGLGRRMLERLGLLRHWRAAASIRRIYRLMCRAAAASGYPRLEVETPYEFLPTLARVWPDYTPETRLITEAFVRVRYGEVPETEGELAVIREAWQRVEAAEPNRRDAPAEGLPTLEKRE